MKREAGGVDGDEPVRQRDRRIPDEQAAPSGREDSKGCDEEQRDHGAPPRSELAVVRASEVQADPNEP